MGGVVIVEAVDLKCSIVDNVLSKLLIYFNEFNQCIASSFVSV